MGGADSKSRVKHFCNYLITKLFHTPLFSVASIIANTLLTTVMKADTGASKHFVREDDIKFLKQVSLLKDGPRAKLPNNKIITSSKQGNLSLSPALSAIAQHAIIYPELRNASLLSVGQLCDDNCLAVFCKHHVWIFKKWQINH